MKSRIIVAVASLMLSGVAGSATADTTSEDVPLEDQSLDVEPVDTHVHFLGCVGAPGQCHNLAASQGISVHWEVDFDPRCGAGQRACWGEHPI